MASPATAALSNGASGNNIPSTQSATTQTIISGKQQNKLNASSKSVDGGRKGTASPVDGGQRRLPTQKAWTQGTNPITGQRPSTHSHQNGNVSQTKSTGTAKTMAVTSRETNTPDKHANDRLLFLLGNFIGLSATITTKNREKFEGIFSGASLEGAESTYVLSMAKKSTSAGDGPVNGATPESNHAYIGEAPNHRMVFETKDVVDLAVNNVSLNESQSKTLNGVTTGFKTDSDISGNLALRERNLQRWEPSSTTDVDLSLESAGSSSWNQFETNERLTGMKSDYDETIYTTSIDRSNPLYKQRAAAAERIAREIESGSTMNAHIAEERGLEIADDTGMDEEQKYSGVHRGVAQNQNVSSTQPSKYTPPARRPPTGQPTVPGPPVDPAIISSQIARAAPSSAAATNGKSTPRLPLRSSPTPQSKEPTTLSESNAIKQGGTQRAATSTVTSSNISPSMRPAGELESMQLRLAPSPGQSTSASPNRVPGRTDDATANVESELLQSFKEFSSTEKMKFIERKRNQAKHDKDIKLNDLMKFSKNFQLKTPVPKDLVPILAKDKTKQEEIMEKAQRNATELSNQAAGSVIRAHNALVEPRGQRNLAAAGYLHGNAVPLAPADRQNVPRGRPGPFNTQHLRGDRQQQAPNLPIISPRAGVPLSGRLADIHQRHKAGGPLPSVTSPVPIQEARQPPTGPAVTTTDLTGSQKPSPAPTPTSAVSTRFNAKAMEFRPNPAAISFTPTGDPSATSSPRSSTNAPQLSRAASPSSFFGTRKPLPSSDRPSLDAALHPIKRMKKEALTEGKDYKFNGNIEPAYRTPPTWPVADENKDKKYTDMFEPAPAPATSSAYPRSSQSTAQLPHQHQLPFHLQSGAQGVPQVHTPQQNPPQLHGHQQHHPAAQHPFDDHRMLFSSSTSSVQPSPRLNQVNMAYPSPMIQHTQLSYGQPMPQYALGPGGPQITHVRQFQGGPQFVHPQGGHAAPMMVHQSSGGPYMGVPQGVGVQFNSHVPMYSPAQGHAYPHPNGPPPLPPSSSGYPSPGRGAPMMMHRSSQQGQPPQQLMWMSPAQHMQPLYAQQQPGQMMRGGYPPPPQQQPHYAPSPHQQHHQPQQHRGHPNGNYAQAPIPVPNGPNHQAPPPVTSANHENDDAK
ncbi:MAG: hypothetical protein M1836_001508 [Candelina mexicana]|nr:MAG: hypothetical protein M1836_001508 [Candelina mexicana]